MKRKTWAAVLAALTFCAAVTGYIHPDSIQAADSYDLTVSIDTDSMRKPISPYIYGVNSDFRTEEYLYPATAGSARQGGNRFSGYNWETNFSNAGRDYKHYSDQYLVDYDKEQLAIPGAPALGFAREAAEKNVPYKITTVQMAGFVAADDGGAVTEDQAAPSSRWIEVKPTKGSPFSLTPDKTDDAVYIDEYVNYLVANLGDATTKTGYQAYNLDNEPSLWSSTHSLMHPEQTTCEEIASKSIAYAAAIKAVDPHAEIFGLALYGVPGYVTFNNAPDWAALSAEYDWFLAYYLDEMRKAEEAHGKRLVDVIDVHYYSEAKGQCRVTECTDYTHTDCIEARVQAPRTLHDYTYLENSWLTGNFAEYLPVFPRIHETIDAYYPGTKIALTEYNFGGGDHISGAVAEADTLGVFAENGIYAANIWRMNTTMEYQCAAINLYTNYDGNGAAFGDTLIASETSDSVRATSYAAIDGADTSRVTLVLTNKSQTETQNAVIEMDADTIYKSAKVYGITGDSPEIRLLDTVEAIDGNRFRIEVPALSVVQVEITGEAGTIRGDVNEDGYVDDKDICDLGSHILARDVKIAYDAADLTGDGQVNGFDLGVLKKLVYNRNNPAPEPVAVPYENTKAGQWKFRDGFGGRTVLCTFKGEPGNQLNIGFGYWDPVTVNPETGKAGIWIHNDTTKLGTHTFDENGMLVLELAIPDKAKSVEIMTYNYTTTDASGNIVQLDKSLFSLESAVLK